jgi:hypothetical protein
VLIERRDLLKQGWTAPILAAAPTPAWLDQCTSSPRDNPGTYDREIFLVLKEFAPNFSRDGVALLNYA